MPGGEGFVEVDGQISEHEGATTVVVDTDSVAKANVWILPGGGAVLDLGGTYGFPVGDLVPFFLNVRGKHYSAGVLLHRGHCAPRYRRISSRPRVTPGGR